MLEQPKRAPKGCKLFWCEFCQGSFWIHKFYALARGNKPAICPRCKLNYVKRIKFVDYNKYIPLLIKFPDKEERRKADKINQELMIGKRKSFKRK